MNPLAPIFNYLKRKYIFPIMYLEPHLEKKEPYILDESQLIPFIPSFNVAGNLNDIDPKLNEEQIDLLINEYIKDGIPITPEQQKSLIENLTSKENFLNEHKKPILKKIYQDASYVEKILEPLRILGVEYSLDVTGGAVRDFVLNQEKNIKDVDLMLSMTYKDGLNEDKLMTIFSQEEIDLVMPDKDTNYNIFEYNSKILELCLNRYNCILTKYNFSNPNFIPKNGDTPYEEFINNSNPDDAKRVRSVFKLDPTKTNYPVDIILTDYSKYSFLNEFDFDICKCSFSLVSSFYKTTFPEKAEYLISRFTSQLPFLANVLNKKITYNSHCKSKSQIKASFSDHLDRILIKYPDYEVKILEPKPYYQSENFEYAKSFYLSLKLNEKLVDHDLNTQTVTKKIKI